MPLDARSFFVADLNVKGELQFSEEYRYELLERVPGAANLIGHFSGVLWQFPDEFEGPLPGSSAGLTFRWRSCSATAGMATLRCRGELVSLSLLASGLVEETDTLTLAAFQQHLLRELRDTGYEPAFGLMELKQRPLVATINFQSPANPPDQAVAALADRCFAASYFRFQRLV
jgi:hypothetical protein